MVTCSESSQFTVRHDHGIDTLCSVYQFMSVMMLNVVAFLAQFFGGLDGWKQFLFTILLMRVDFKISQ